MYGRLHEDVAWTRLQDLQREMENRRLMAAPGEPASIRLMRSVGRPLWHAAEVAWGMGRGVYPRWWTRAAKSAPSAASNPQRTAGA